MEKLRILAKNINQKNEIIGYLIELGYNKNCWTSYDNDDLMGIHVYENGGIQDVMDDDYEDENHKEITLPQIRDMVVLKRNDVADATHSTESCGAKGFLSSDGVEYFWEYGVNVWSKHGQSNFAEYEMKPITKEPVMKEFLDKEKLYTYVKDTAKRSEDWIEIPEGAEVAYFFHGLDLKSDKDDIAFYKDNIGSVYNDDGWLGVGDEKVKPFVLSKGFLLWQRHTIPEELPFVDDEPSLNDQYAEIEQVRQTQIGGNHYSKLAIQPMEYSLANGIDAGQHTVIKYVTRFKDKGGIEDLHKAKHTIDLLIAHYYGVEK